MSVAPKLTVQNAEIKTATVEIQTLTISGKQVTLAVFRQLHEEPLIAEDCTLNGEPWGTVNYHPDKCGDDSKHLHVVWQKGSNLLRSRVNAPWAASHACPAASRFLQAAVHEGFRRGADFPGISEPGAYINTPNPGRNDGLVSGSFTHKGVLFEAQIWPEASRVWGGAARGQRHYDEQALADWYERAETTAEEAAKLLPAGAYQAAWRKLNDLPQLFIAV